MPLASPRSMSFRTGELDGEMGIRGEGGMIHKAVSSSRRNVSFKKGVSKVERGCWDVSEKHRRVVATQSWRGIRGQIFLE